MKKMMAAMLGVFLLAGCAGQAAKPVETEPAAGEQSFRILTPIGAPALALLPAALNQANELTIVDGPDVLQAELVNPSDNYDIVIAPTNLGVKLAAAEKTDYRLLSVVSWGNLYIVGADEDVLNRPGEFAAFGENAVVGLVFRKLYPDIVPNITWYSSAQEVAQAVLSGRADAGLLAEPAATAMIGKAKEAGRDLAIVKDVQKDWGEAGYPQAGLFVRRDAYNEDSARYNAFVDLLAEYHSSLTPEKLSADLEAIDLEKFGMPGAGVVSMVWDRMNIKIIQANGIADMLNEFMGLFGVENAAEALNFDN